MRPNNNNIRCVRNKKYTQDRTLEHEFKSYYNYATYRQTNVPLFIICERINLAYHIYHSDDNDVTSFFIVFDVASQSRCRCFPLIQCLVKCGLISPPCMPPTTTYSQLSHGIVRLSLFLLMMPLTELYISA